MTNETTNKKVKSIGRAGLAPVPYPITDIQEISNTTGTTNNR
jgi:hypothetical protein